jgi:NitT/TauT family transport system ATP-binding protein
MPDSGSSLGLAARPPMQAPKLTVRGVSKSFESVRGETVHALEDITFDVSPGEFLCILGPTGSGKSTVLNLLAGLEQADRGEVLVDQRPVTGPGPDRAVLFQDPALFPAMSVRGNVEFALRMVGVHASERRSVADRWLSKFGLTAFARAQPHELSAGMRQRVALARALACRPEVLLADEPFGSLDAQARELLQQQVQEVWEETGATFVFVTHNVREAVRLADRVLLMSASPGTLLEEYRIHSPRPRHLEDPMLVRVVGDIHDRLQEEVNKVVAREAGEQEGLG